MSEPNDDLLERLRDLVAWDPGDGDDEGFSLLREAADRIEELESALRDALALLPPDRWRLLLPQYVEPIRQAIASGAIDGMSFRFRVTREEWDDSDHE